MAQFFIITSGEYKPAYYKIGDDIVSGLPIRQIIIWKRKGGINFNPGYFLPTYEVIYMIAKPEFKLVEKANAHGDIWEFGQESKNRHPAPFPVALIERIISSTSAKIVLDPFMGSGTTALAAKNLDRNFIGIDLSPNTAIWPSQRLNDPLSVTRDNKKDKKIQQTPLFDDWSVK